MSNTTTTSLLLNTSLRHLGKHLIPSPCRPAVHSKCKPLGSKALQIPIQLQVLVRPQRTPAETTHPSLRRLTNRQHFTRVNHKVKMLPGNIHSLPGPPAHRNRRHLCQLRQPQMRSTQFFKDFDNQVLPSICERKNHRRVNLPVNPADCNCSPVVVCRHYHLGATGIRLHFHCHKKTFR